jgi:hypothetical protein
MGRKSILKSLNFISETSMSRLVFELCSPTFKKFIKLNYFEIDIEKMVEEINDNLEPFAEFMHFSTQKKYWTEVLKSTVFTFTNSIFSLNMKGYTMDQLTEKLTNDRQTFIDSFNMLGSNQLDEQTRILELISEFLNTSLEMLSFSCSNIKKQAGKNFNLKIAKSLIKLRNDWNSDDKEEAEVTCKEILENYEKTNKVKKAEFHNEFFAQLHDDLQKETGLEEHAENVEKQNEDSLKSIDNVLRADKHKDTSGKRATIMLDSFLDDMETNENDAENENENTKSGVHSRKDSQDSLSELTELTDVVIEGYMSKKKHKNWQERYFQLKNKKLYWYETKESSRALNFIDLKDVVKLPFAHKPGKFTLLCDKEYKFELKTPEECEEWIKAIKDEMNKHKTGNKIKFLFQIELKKKIITMQGRILPSIYEYKGSMKNKVMLAMKTENFFLPKRV